MAPIQLSSGDLIADRRAGYARMLAESGDMAAAADLQAQALELAPSWAAGWHELGRYREAAGDLEGAAEAWRTVLALDSIDVFGAGLKLALIGRSSLPDAPPSEYVAQLFDDYADRFDTALVENLAYRVPELLADMIAAAAGPEARFARTVDLGCGTGLFGARIRQATSWLEGYDLSEGMLAKAEAKGLYDRLDRADIRFGLPDGDARSADLVAAADVFAYFGDLEPVIALCGRLTAANGLLAFSLEAGEDGVDWRLQPSLRYCHGEAYVRRVLDAHGFGVVAMTRAAIRTDGPETITGLIVVARRSAAATVSAAVAAIAQPDGDIVAGDPPLLN